MSEFEVVEFNGIKYAEVIRSNVVVKESTFFSDSKSSFQFGLLSHKTGFHEPSHYHKKNKKNITDNQQLLVVQKGIIIVELYNNQGQLLKEISLEKGDAIVLIHGIHAIRVAQDTQCITVKQGPYLGDREDKVITEDDSSI